LSFIYIYIIYINIYIFCVYIYIYIHRKSERERERERTKQRSDFNFFHAEKLKSKNKVWNNGKLNGKNTHANTGTNSTDNQEKQKPMLCNKPRFLHIQRMTNQIKMNKGVNIKKCKCKWLLNMRCIHSQIH
jgi:hypothetical protein